MKKITLSLLTLLLLAACSGGDKGGKSIDSLIEDNNLEALEARRETVKAEQRAIQTDLKKLEDAIKKLDTTDKSALVTAHVVQDTLFQHYIELQGNVETKQNVLVYPEYQGTLTRVFVKEGDKVRKGQILARIDDGGLSSQVSQLEVQAQLAKTTFERQERLWNQKIGSEIQYLEAKTNYEAAQSAVNQLKSQLGKTAVKAPFSGVVDDVITEQGTVVAPGQAIFRVVNLNDMYIKADVPERYLSSIVPGKEVSINFPVLGKTITSEVRQTGNYINPGNRTFSVEIDVPSEGGTVKPNLTARIRINDYTKENAVLIPLSVISENAAGEQYVYLAQSEGDSLSNKGVAKRRGIETGKAQGDIIEVLEGLKSGDAIIVEGARAVKDDQEITIIKD